MNKTHIISDAFGAEELAELLKGENTGGLQLELEKEADNTMALDPVTLTAIITTSSTVLTTLITGLFSVWNKKQELKNKTDQAVIKVKTEGGELEVPQGTSPEKLAELLKTIENKPVKRVALITDI